MSWGFVMAFASRPKICPSGTLTVPSPRRSWRNEPPGGEWRSAQEGFVQTAVHGDDLAGRLAQALGHEQKIRFRLVRRGDGGLGQRTVGVELRQLAHERFGRLVLTVGDVVF